ncbi:MAG: hypothetical protein WD512_11110, partial [Candidatus Paceibacterota bacterium]
MTTSMTSVEMWNIYKKWLKDPSQDFINTCFSNYIQMPYFMSISPQIKRTDKIDDGKPDMINNYKNDVNLIMQFYVDKNYARQNEIKKCLFFNVNNKLINKIYLFNEREYTKKELGIDSEKIIQIVTGKRLTYESIFNLIEQHSINGYIVIANSDIFFDSSLDNIKTCDFTEKNVLALCRHEYKGSGPLINCRLFEEGRPDSQDAWIFHSDINVPREKRNIFNFPMGKSGCDNKLIYLFQILGYQCYNEATLIKIYHYHNVQTRNYNTKDKVPSPYCALFPITSSEDKLNLSHSFNIIIENQQFCNYINRKIKENKPFIIPRIAGVENEMAYHGAILMQSGNVFPQKYFEKPFQIMKNNAGIKLSNNRSIVKYSKSYLSAFEMCDAYFDWEPWSGLAKSIFKSLNFIFNNFKKQRFWSLTLDVFDHITTKPWTQELTGKRILIVSPFVESFKDKINIRDKIYGIELFPNCEFIFLKPPQTQANCYSEEFDIELNRFVEKIREIKDDFDISLLSCGGYGNLVCSEIYKMGKSAIYVGGVLQMYFGVYGNRWERERPEIISLYKNEYWSRPKEEE